MNKNFIAFIFGVGTGSLVTWLCVKKYYADKTQRDIDSVKEVLGYNKRASEISNDEEYSENSQVKEDKPSIEDYIASLKSKEDIDYTKYAKKKESTKETISELVPEEESIIYAPYKIDEMEYGEYEDYQCIELTLYADGVLTEGDEVLEDVDDLIGTEYEDYFDDDNDCVYIRNDRLGIDYQIVLDTEYWYKVKTKKPHPVEVE